MWKRENESTTPVPAPATPIPAAPAAPSAATRREPETVAVAPRPLESSAPIASTGRATIGSGTVVRGEISGEEDLLVEGRVEGKIDLKGNSVTIGAKGRLSAEVHARAILIDGEVDGDLTAEEQIVVRKSGRVRGDLTAPRVTIEDGARFKGSIDMEPKRASAPMPTQMPSRSSGKGDPMASLAAAAGSGT